MYFQSCFFSFLLPFFFLHPCGEACQCGGIRHCVVNTTVKQTAVKFLLIDLQSLAMSSWRHSMSSRALWVILACGSAIDRAPRASKNLSGGCQKKKGGEILQLLWEKWWKACNCRQKVLCYLLSFQNKSMMIQMTETTGKILAIGVLICLLYLFRKNK